MRKKMIFMPFIVVGFIALAGFVVMEMWNWLMPELFDLGTINFWQALGLLVLSKILFGGMRWGGCGGCCGYGHKGHYWKHKFKHKFANMSEEDKEKWKRKWDQCYPETKKTSDYAKASSDQETTEESASSDYANASSDKEESS